MARTTRRTTIAAIGLVTAMTIAACGGDDDVVGRASEGSAGDAATENTDDDTGDASTGSSDANASGDQPADDTTPATTDDSSPTSVPVPEPGELIGPPPDTDAMSPANGPPGPEFALFEASAKVSVGGSTIEFEGLDTLWFTEFNLSGRPIWETSGSMFDRGAEADRAKFADILVAACSVILPSGGGVSAQASFRHQTDREGHSSFSMSDNGDGTVIWGLYNAAKKEEWSATGEGSATVSYLKYTSPTDPDWTASELEQYRFNSAFREALGFQPRTEDVYMVIEFSGEASENFSTEKSDASSTVICQYVVPIS